MESKLELSHVNTNPYAFEEIATSLATLTSFMAAGRDAMAGVLDAFQHLYRHALQQPPTYREITELAGHGLKACDGPASRAAWLLMNVQDLDVSGVHSLVCHKVSGRYAAPILDQVGSSLGLVSELSAEQLQSLGSTNSLLDVLGTKDGSVWLVQALVEAEIVNSAVKRQRQGSLFQQQNIFRAPVLNGSQLSALCAAHRIVRLAFPTVPIKTMALVIHSELPDFELFDVPVSDPQPQSVVLSQNNVVMRSTEFADRLAEDHEALWTRPARLEDELFRGLPPCRGGRTLGLLASIAVEQRKSDSLLIWKERKFRDVLKNDFKYDVPRDKVRHDLVDRLILQGFMRKWESGYHLMPKGIARYLYCLAKYTTRGITDPMDVLEACQVHRQKVLAATGCL